MTTTCNKCGKTFEVVPSEVKTAEAEDLSVQYFLCPACGEKYIVFAADAEMKGLVEEHQALRQKLRTAQRQRFREKTIREYMRDLSRVKAKQEALLPGLKRRAMKLMEAK